MTPRHTDGGGKIKTSDSLSRFEVEEVDLFAGEGPTGDEDPLPALVLHHEAGVSVALLGQIRHLGPPASLRVQELDGGDGPALRIAADDEEGGLIHGNSAEALMKKRELVKWDKEIE